MHTKNRIKITFLVRALSANLQATIGHCIVLRKTIFNSTKLTLSFQKEPVPLLLVFQ